MTWVFGNPTILGSAVCVADIQVTAGDDTHDCLRKLYPMDQNVLAGFAGDVWTGFQMLEALHHLIAREKGEHGAPIEIERLCERFSRVAKTTFEEQPSEHQAGGCQVMIAGGSPAENAIYGSRTFAARFSWPNFECDAIPRGEWRSIGSGADVAGYQAELESVVGPEGGRLDSNGGGLARWLCERNVDRNHAVRR